MRLAIKPAGGSSFRSRVTHVSSSLNCSGVQVCCHRCRRSLSVVACKKLKVVFLLPVSERGFRRLTELL